MADEEEFARMWDRVFSAARDCGMHVLKFDFNTDIPNGKATTDVVMEKAIDGAVCTLSINFTTTEQDPKC